MVKSEESNKENLIQRVRLHDRDTGSADVQIAQLTNMLTEKMERYRETKDNVMRLDAMRMVNQRKNLLNYLKSTDTARFKYIAEILDIQDVQLNEAS